MTSIVLTGQRKRDHVNDSVPFEFAVQRYVAEHITYTGSGKWSADDRYVVDVPLHFDVLTPELLDLVRLDLIADPELSVKDLTIKAVKAPSLLNYGQPRRKA